MYHNVGSLILKKRQKKGSFPILVYIIIHHQSFGYYVVFYNIFDP